eukprot:CAMPEP_0113665108 /NCGR_PEP_ID=MMETSP0038_2-20120614/2115_1 /TAXON_ID=2898 /ORGANISM="Cryptomonas paramecium" /LENGTH=160 /DNA_ID=CAMNT_0000580411 /DNA_START=12 /DNA_END=491 /DNA_ORIENTATION=+ /assembly_acc=CAM_ASM_000170
MAIAIYVYNRPEYFREVVNSLRRVQGVHDVLLVISTDGLTEGMLSIIESIDFCGARLLLHPAPSPAFGHAGGRGADGVVVVKQHRAWLLNQVFFRLRETRSRPGDVLILEEDHRPTPDAIATLRRLLAVKNGGDCPACWAVALQFGCENKDKETDPLKFC